MDYSYSMKDDFILNTKVEVSLDTEKEKKEESER